MLFLAGITFSMVQPGWTLADGSDTDSETTEEDDFGTMSSGDICCNWMLNDYDDLVNENPSGNVGIGDFEVGDPVNYTFEVRGDMGGSGELEIEERIRTEETYEAGNFNRDDQGLRMVLVNEDGEIVDVPIDPSVMSWIERLEEINYFSSHGFSWHHQDLEVIGDNPPHLSDVNGGSNWCSWDEPSWEYNHGGSHPEAAIAHSGGKDVQVGINTCLPNHALEVNGSGMFKDSLIVNDLVRFRHAVDEQGRARVGFDDDEGFIIGTPGQTDGLNEINFIADGEKRMELDGDGDLDVDGKIRARSIEVTQDDFWPDYVFEPDYDLRSLNSLSAYIEENQSLPGIPTKEEVKEEGAVDLGAMQRNLIEKVEEQALYILELHEEKQQLKKEVKELRVVKEEIEELEERIEAIER